MATRNLATRRGKLKQVHALYERVAPFGETTCTYCGDESDSWDHVAPLAHVAALVDAMPAGRLRRIVGEGLRLVPCCRDCNSRLGDFLAYTVDEKRIELAARLYARHRKLLSGPDWSRKEVAALGDGLALHVRANQDLRDWISERLKWASWSATETP